MRLSRYKSIALYIAIATIGSIRARFLQQENKTDDSWIRMLLQIGYMDAVSDEKYRIL